MPELPEVETIRLGLTKFLPGKKILKVTSDNAKSFPNDPRQVKKFLTGAMIKKVDRRGKVLIIELNNDYSLLIHLKMTGQLVFRDRLSQGFGGGHPTDSLVGRLPDRSTRVIFALSGGAKLFFNDQRKFGWVRLVPTDEVPKLDFFKKIGPEPLGPEYNFQAFQAALARRPRSSIKAAILDQTVIAGVGNIYADESLHAARIHPATRVQDLTSQKSKKLFVAIPQSLRLSLVHGGSTDRNYIDAEGKKGSYLKFARVFRREGQPCPDCGGLIKKIRVAGRGTHFCPSCQKLPRHLHKS